jgi:hypothetical protein
MSENPTTPRRPLVPGPSSVSERAVALRTQAQVQAAQPEKRTNGSPPLGLAAPSTHVVAMHPTPVGHIAGAIAAIMANVGTIEKGGVNKFFGYKYARMEDLLHVITPLMGKNGLAVIQNEMSKEVLEGNRLAITYEFSILHSSNEIWPEKPRHTGMSTARDSKGNWDDKAVAKCHTNARKYFLLSLFQVPAGDFDDADAEDANQRKQKAPVPGPSAPPLKEITEEAKARASEQATKEGIPHKILLGQGSGPDQWAGAFIRAINAAETAEDVQAWDKENDAILQNLSDKYPGVYDQIDSAVRRRLWDLGGSAMPDPQADSQAAMNWVAEQLSKLQSLAAIEMFWNRTVAPHEDAFDRVDWGMLLEEFKRNENRVNPPDDEPPQAA